MPEKSTEKFKTFYISLNGESGEQAGDIYRQRVDKAADYICKYGLPSLPREVLDKF